ncbi:hypothetical protein AXG93_4587s1040 [Marchantia polymorpha subsp. ruderalis]|uniref:Uncharacterized protein n=1 Tax=Marchantia polymorpha subsp. ruderalis TaxID=1480154 RepID=A0A176WLQ0_MARPO|nr:hypothetical protein AXG93_4587s1040 [Marchantia polymorpha subsp. ruderalis]
MVATRPVAAEFVRMTTLVTFERRWRVLCPASFICRLESGRSDQTGLRLVTVMTGVVAGGGGGCAATGLHAARTTANAATRNNAVLETMAGAGNTSENTDTMLDKLLNRKVVSDCEK